MEYQSAVLILAAMWPVVFMAGIVLLWKREANRERQHQLNDALRTLQFVAMQKRGRIWK